MQSGNYNQILTTLANEGFQIIKKINLDLTSGTDTYEYYDEIFFDTIKSEFQSMESALMLSESNKFKDSLILLRTIFELFLYYWLMVDGKKYRHRHEFTVESTSSKTQQEARDETLTKWRMAKSEGNPSYKNIISMDPIGTDRIVTIYEYDGVYEEKDTNHTGKWYSMYSFILTDHYYPTLRFIAELPSIISGDMFPDITKQQVKEQKTIYNSYIHIDSIISNLILNGLITKTQSDYVRIHYNFLSTYVHPTRHAVRDYTQDIPDARNLNVPDKFIKELILLYVCKIQHLLLKITINKFEKQNPYAIIKPYIELISKLNAVTSDFWFIDNNPTAFDIHVSKTRMASANWKNPTKQTDEKLVLYYEDPLKRLMGLRGEYVI